MEPDRSTGRIPNSQQLWANPLVTNNSVKSGGLPTTMCGDDHRIRSSLRIGPSGQPMTVQGRSGAIPRKTRGCHGPVFPRFDLPAHGGIFQPNPQAPHKTIPCSQFVHFSGPNFGQNTLLENPKKPLLGKAILLKIPAPFVAGTFFAKQGFIPRWISSIKPASGFPRETACL